MGTRLPDAAEHRSRLPTDTIGVAQIERDATDIDLMSDIRRKYLERDRKPDSRGDTGGLVCIVGGTAGRDRDSITREQGPGRFRVEPGIPRGERSRDHPLCRSRIRFERVSSRGRRLHQQLSIVAIVYAVQETGNPAVGGFIGGDAGFRKELPCRPRGIFAEPGCDYVAIAQRLGQRCRQHRTSPAERGLGYGGLFQGTSNWRRTRWGVIPPEPRQGQYRPGCHGESRARVGSSGAVRLRSRGRRGWDGSAPCAARISAA